MKLYSLLVVLLLLPSRLVMAISCEQWFKATKIDKDSKQCFPDCIVAQIGMGTFSCHLQCADFCRFSSRTWIYFGNGVFNIQEEARRSAKKLREKFLPFVERYPDLRPLIANSEEIQVAYNVDGDKFLQLIQAFEQKVNTEFQNLWRWLDNLSAAPEWFRKQVAYGILSEDEGFEKRDPELREHVARYSSHLEKGDGILVVSHSQGNFYAHAAHRLTMKKYGVLIPFKIIPVASPYFEDSSEKLYNGWPYTTLFSDGVIRFLVPHHFPPNVRNEPAGLWDHEFVERYLNGNNSGPKILNDMSCMVSTFRMRAPSFNWFSESDFDHDACKKLIPHPEVEKDDAEEQ
jgi:hypothetical protein